MNENFNYFERQSPLAQTPVLNRPHLNFRRPRRICKTLTT